MRDAQTRYRISLESNIESLNKEIENSDLSDFDFGVLIGRKAVYESQLAIFHLKKVSKVQQEIIF